MKFQRKNVTVEGQIKYDPEMRYTPTGRAITTITVILESDTIRAEAWDALAEYIAFSIVGGDKVTMNGSYQTKKWVDRDENEREYEYFAIKTIDKLTMINREEKRSYE